MARDLFDRCSRRDVAHKALASAVPATELLTRPYGPRLCGWLVVAIGRQVRNGSLSALTGSGSPAVSVQVADDTSAHQAFNVGFDLVSVRDIEFHRLNLLRDSIMHGRFDLRRPSVD